MSDSTVPAHPVRTADEFAPAAADELDPVSRRRFLHLMAASLALGGAACTRQPQETIVPYVRQPVEMTPGIPLLFATAMDLGGDARGLLVRSNEGRPTKIEGNPDHPESAGRSSVHMQAALLDLYDPDRSRTVLKAGQPATWEDLLGALVRERPKWQSERGKGVRLLTRRIASPTLRGQIVKFLTEFPEARWHIHDPAFPISPAPAHLRLDRAKVILTLGAELFGPGGWETRAAREFSQGRKPGAAFSRLYAVEAMPTLAGAMADHRWAMSPQELGLFAQALLDSLMGKEPSTETWQNVVVADLEAHRGAGVVVAAEWLGPEVHAAVRAINDALGNTGTTIEYHQPALSTPDSVEGLGALAQAMHAGEIHTLVTLEANPLYDAPADLEFAAALKKVASSFHVGHYCDETGSECGWHIPQSHFLESWGDTQTRSGVVSIIQPLIEPLYPTHTLHEVLAALLGENVVSPYDLLRAAWQERSAGEDFERLWRSALHNGVAETAALPAPEAARQERRANQKEAAAPSSLELLIIPDPYVLDGRFANNGWLQELPRPVTQLTWENAAYLGPATAWKYGLTHGDVVELQYRERKIEAPVWVLPIHAEGCVTIHLGYGRTRAGRAGDGLGFDAFQLQTSDKPHGGSGLELRRTGKRHTFSTTQPFQSMEGREPVRVLAAAEWPHFQAEPTPAESLYPGFPTSSPAWGMVIDLTTCIGCASCTIACQAENNIPVVGREQVLAGRAMHWIRVDRYFAEGAGARQMLHQPVPCMHCENAPCEAVCPVAATVHDHEGLNLMVYNRCVGTRYCSNNCPYKVRRFNFLKYVDTESATLQLMRNPEVSVRSRGVMEKCTYCVQRISAGRIRAKKEDRAIRDGEVVPACAQACPADAITFGDLMDSESRVRARRSEPHHYGLLAELNTRPRTTYLARVRNPHPEIG